MLVAALIAGLLLLLVVSWWVIATYNRLVGVRNRSEEAWSGIDVQLQRRADLVPNLVRVVETYRIHERDVLTEVTEARSQVASARGPREAGTADDHLERALMSLYAVAENYPQLRASENFLELQRELATLEEEISFARRYYNGLAQRLNTAVESFPEMIVARLFGFVRIEYFKADPADRIAPVAEFGR
jgi:LemA protein